MVKFWGSRGEGEDREKIDLIRVKMVIKRFLRREMKLDGGEGVVPFSGVIIRVARWWGKRWS